jgi:para-nitrobenzyl esterase
MNMKNDETTLPSALQLSRRQLLEQGLGVGAGAAATGLSFSAFAQTLAAASGTQAGRAKAGDNPIVRTKLGRIKGAVDRNVYAFKGIHYGQSTAGANRFRAPQEPQSWSGIIHALQYGQSAPQSGPAGPPNNGLLGDSPAGEGEDCLVLNVWTPSLDQAKRPVMVWFHGGGWSSGSASIPTYDGVNIANRGDVVLVSVNHRLGLMGYLYLGDHGGDRSSGVAGVLDMVAALQWVNDNIEAFGGDKRNVTIFGESGGAVKVRTLMGLPAAKGLFHKAIMESGSAPHWMNHEQGKQVADHVLKYLGGTKAADIHALPLAKLLEAQFKAIPAPCTPPRPSSGLTGAADNITFFPVIDGQVMKRAPSVEIMAGLSAEVAFIIGSNKDEGALFLGMNPELKGMTEARLREILSSALFDHTNAIVDAYKAARPHATPADLWVAISSAYVHYCDITVIEQEKLPKASAPVYRYQFVYDQPYPGGLKGTGHAKELAFVFDTVATSPQMLGGAKPTDADFAARQALASKVSDAWIAFARTGNPTHKGIPKWPAYTRANRETMILKDTCEVVNNPFAAEQKAWEGYVLQVPLPQKCST